jgi:hypothetical protein
MADTIRFTLDGKIVEANPGETLWEISKRQGTTIPHLCHKDRLATGLMETAAPAWSRLTVNGFWLHRASARQQMGWWCIPTPAAPRLRARW